MIRKYKFPILGATVLCLVIAGVAITKRVRTHTVGSKAGHVNNVPRAAIATVKRGEISNTISIAGEFLPYQEVELHAKVTGYIRTISVDIGDHVRTGQVLAILEVPERAAQVQGADAGVRYNQAEILRAQDEVTRAQAEHAALHAAAMRLNEAAEAQPGLVAQQELDDAEAKDRAAGAQVSAARSALAAARRQLEVAKATQMQVSAISDYSRIRAPFDGVVTWRYSDTGALVQAGTSSGNAQPVVKIAQVNVLRLRFPVPASLAASVHEGQPANVLVQATGEKFMGRVTRFAGALDRSTRSMQVEIDVPNDKLHIDPEMYADVVLQAEKRSNVLLIPVEALTKDDKGPSVFVVDNRNRVQAREIHTGLQTPNSVEVTAGLSDGDRVIVGNLDSYHQGQVVEPKESRLALSEFKEAEQ
jgi:RND family efflux transporter MFP subunit